MKKPSWFKGAALVAVSSVLIIAAGAIVALLGEAALTPVLATLVVVEVVYMSMS